MESPEKRNVLKYRPDVDGLRAIAVISVIIFHLDESWLPGGFLGVDIFFVISGYLISLLLIRQVDASGSLDLIGFYRRRIQRILPALVTMLAVVLPFAFIVLIPEDFSGYLQSMLWSILSAANMYFLFSIDTGYFAPDSDVLPLLHLWSLGVEEQFYIIWPFIVWLVLVFVKRPVVRLAVISALLVLSLASAQMLLPERQEVAYYLFPTRAWELLAGCLAAFIVHGGWKPGRVLSEVAAFAGLTAIACSFALVDETSLVPGVSAVPAVAGSALMILFAEHASSGRILGSRSFVFVGLLSYSAYLWHWPVIAFLNYTYVEIGAYLAVAVVLITFLLAYATYYLVEKPLRKPRDTRDVYVKYLGVPLLLLVPGSIALGHIVEKHTDTVYPQAFSEAKEQVRPASDYSYNCQYYNFDLALLPGGECIYPGNGKPRILLAGDSNAAHFLGTFRRFSDQFGFAFQNASQSGCPLLLPGEIDWLNLRFPDGCSNYREAIRKQAAEFDVLIIGGQWTYYENRSRVKFRTQFQEMLEYYLSVVDKVVILGTVPRISGYSRACELRASRVPYIDCEKRFTKKVREYGVNAFLKNQANSRDRVEYFGVREVLCSNDICSAYLDGVSVYYNASHLSLPGSEYIGEYLLHDAGLGDGSKGESMRPLFDIFVEYGGDRQQVMSSLSGGD